MDINLLTTLYFPLAALGNNVKEFTPVCYNDGLMSLTMGNLLEALYRVSEASS